MARNFITKRMLFWNEHQKCDTYHSLSGEFAEILIISASGKEAGWQVHYMLMRYNLSPIVRYIRMRPYLPRYGFFLNALEGDSVMLWVNMTKQALQNYNIPLVYSEQRELLSFVLA